MILVSCLINYWCFTSSNNSYIKCDLVSQTVSCLIKRPVIKLNNIIQSHSNDMDSDI